MTVSPFHFISTEASPHTELPSPPAAPLHLLLSSTMNSMEEVPQNLTLLPDHYAPWPLCPRHILTAGSCEPGRSVHQVMCQSHHSLDFPITAWNTEWLLWERYMNSIASRTLKKAKHISRFGGKWRQRLFSPQT